MSGQQVIPKTYNPHLVEEKWSQFWINSGFFHAEVDPSREPFCIVIPPPNVTGSLHLGHALNNTIQDILVRWRRMQGYNTLWLPGTDHAGIATQARVEEELAKEGLTKHDLGREKFLERVWAWKEVYGGEIIKQLKRLGASCDWERERFTMDQGCSRAVREVFRKLYEKGLIYRGNYIINWCPKCQTTISDIEVEHVEHQGKLYYIRYPGLDGSSGVVVATTRPETMLGDTGVAVHPEDPRYQHLVGKKVLLPLMDRPIPVVADEAVDPDFGTGAVKVTPAHDPTDFEIGNRHNLPQVVVIGRDGRMTEAAGKYAFLTREEARQQVVSDLEKLGLLLKVEDHDHAVGHCYRCDTVIEPLVSEQWFVKMKPLAEPALRAVKEGKIRFIPERFTKIYLNWVENIKDWCISRQLWWGHRIPVWYCQDCGAEICPPEDPQVCPHCQSPRLEQDPDVLDTWFSSALWPFSTLGWPEKTPELSYFYPTSVLVTGRDIIFFWVARMIFMGLEFMKEVPFKEVLIHGLVLDSLGRKMSKSLGNGIDPLEVIDKYGADTLRFMLVTGNTPGNDMRFHWERVEGTRNFANKVWNAARFALLNLRDFRPGDFPQELTLADRWILSRFNSTVEEVTRDLELYELGEAARVLYEFIWNEFCDWYIELVKPRLYGSASPEIRYAAQYVLWYVLLHTLELLHPFMPFITEEIWQHLPHSGESITIASWPTPREDFRAVEAEQEMEFLMEVIRAIRNLRRELNLPPAKQVYCVLVTDEERWCRLLEEYGDYLKDLAGVEGFRILETGKEKPSQALTAVVRGVEIYLPLAGLVDLDKEIQRLEKELRLLEGELKKVRAKLTNEKFLAKAPPEIVEKERAKEEELEKKHGALARRLVALRG
ncbi:MAG: Valine--tRNA ligase [Thermacetogenium phaeum]|uniref:Valine--tRNA ligase n=1 Tax=Thermacetogenium phaeum TaxID=85874 RepID=A0A117LB22_9THEO|nr:MAG: Valine--tRNA ligase [Thermacetogenium phaeum]